MYICNDCGHVFLEDECGEQKDYHDELPGGPCETFAVCPECGGSDFEKAELCTVCNEHYRKSDIEGVCPECGKSAMDKLKKLLKYNFTKNELIYLDYKIEYDSLFLQNIYD